MDRHLPPEIISIIREFAKPRFRFPKEYKEAMRILNHIEWPSLKKKLCTKDADQVLASLIAYTRAVVAKRNADDVHDTFHGISRSGSPLYFTNIDWTEKDRLRKVCRDAMRLQTIAYHDLMMKMYHDWPGEEPAYTDTEDDE
jgi:hypothetical protein